LKNRVHNKKAIVKKERKRGRIFRPLSIEAKTSIKREIGRYATITFGAMIQGLGQAAIFIPAKLAPGGLMGIGLILNHAWGFPIGLTYALMNVPFFLWAFKALGMQYILRTGYAVVISALTIDVASKFLAPYIPFITGQDQLILSAIFGGVVGGFGIGLIFRSGGSIGGTDVISQLIYWLTGLEYGKVVLILDAIVIVGVATYFGITAGNITQGYTLALYSVLALFTSSQILNMVQSGMTSTKMVVIITEQPELIRLVILEKLGRGVTIMDAKGGYTMSERSMIFVAVPQSQIGSLKEFIHDLDNKAFVMVAELSEVVGKGFGRKLPV